MRTTVAALRTKHALTMNAHEISSKPPMVGSYSLSVQDVPTTDNLFQHSVVYTAATM